MLPSTKTKNKIDHKAKSIRPFIGAKDFNLSKAFYRDLGFDETVLSDDMSVFKTNGLRIVLIALHEGAGMKKHTANGLISVQVLEGKLQFNAGHQSVELNNGQMLALHERIPHGVVAMKETIFLLTLTTTLAVK